MGLGPKAKIQETQIQILKMKPFGSSSFQNPLKLRAKISKIFIIITNLCCNGSFGVGSQNRRSTQRFAFWCNSLSSCTSLQHRCALGHWATWYCFAELLGDASTTPFFRRLEPFLKGLAHWNKRRSKTLQRLAKWSQLNYACTQQDSIYTYAKNICVLKDSSCDTQLQRFSSSQYLLQIQVQAQQKRSNALTQMMIPFSHTKV
ncbi:hypothetical protein H5410_041924 [Solanum commersonii]|uniref:Uncharacterized protein n=1 Tax=Solanum commersonii TaxID=4109 RepID=A0A9J5XUJ3_SOLCO|nr:hypothetical protein H5410_041924 [Solanum commersonii]